MPVAAGDGDVVLRRAEGPNADRRRPVANEERRERQDDEERHEHDPADRVAPAVGAGQPGKQREEDELPGGIGGGEDSRRKPTTGDEPPVRDHRGERDRDGSGGEPVDDAPEQDELPLGVHHERQRRADRDHGDGDEDAATQSEAVVQRGGEGAAEAVDHEVEPGGERDRGGRPAELLAQGVDEDPDRRAESRHRHEDDQRSDEDDPRGVEPERGARRHRRQYRRAARGYAACEELAGSHLEELDDVTRDDERIGDRIPTFERRRGHERSIRLRDQHVTTRQRSLGELLEASQVRLRRSERRGG